MQELKLSLSETIRNPDVSVLMLLENPMVSFAIDTGVPNENGENTHLYDLAVIDGKKIWVGGSGKLLQLFDLHGNLHQSLTVPCGGSYLCIYKEQIVFRDYKEKALKKSPTTTRW